MTPADTSCSPGTQLTRSSSCVRCAPMRLRQIPRSTWRRWKRSWLIARSTRLSICPRTIPSRSRDSRTGSLWAEELLATPCRLGLVQSGVGLCHERVHVLIAVPFRDPDREALTLRSNLDEATDQPRGIVEAAPGEHRGELIAPVASQKG